MSGRTPLHLAITVELLRILIDSGADVNALDNNGVTPLKNLRRMPWLVKVSSELEKLGGKE